MSNSKFQQDIAESFADFQQEHGTINYEATILNMGTALMEKDALIAQLRGGQKGQLKKEIAELKKKFELVEQSTESCAYMELEIERLKSDDYKQEILRENMDDAMGNWVDEVFGASDLDEVKKQMDKLKAENTVLTNGADTLTDLMADAIDKIAELKAENEKMDVVKWANQYAELQAEHEKLKEQVGIIIAEELRSVQEENEWIQNEKAELVRKVQEYDPSFVYCNCHSSEEEEEEDVKVGEGDVGWEKY